MSRIASAQPLDGVCARVKVRLSQEITLTRDVFNASLEIHDNDAIVPLEGIRVEFAVTDEAGTDVGGLFQLTPPALIGLGDIAGNSNLGPLGSASVVYTLKPTRAAAPTVDKKYFASGWLRYRELGQEVAVRLAPTPFIVRPDPLLVLDYFWQRDVYSDDPFTEPIEASEPFSVGLRVRNDGYGVARNMRIKTSQPTITENKKGLLVDFRLVGTQVNDQEVTPELLVNLGDILPTSTTTARWLLTSSLAGQFIDFSASFEHLDGLGDPRVSLIDSVKAHALDHVVRIIDPTDDGRLDFLTDENYQEDTAHLPDHVSNSDGTDSPVTALTDGTFSNRIDESHPQTRLNVSAPSNGFFYVRLNDPADAEFRLKKVIRSDGREIRVSDNAWTTHRIVHTGGSPVTENRFHLFDQGGDGKYTLIYGPLDEGALGLGTAKTVSNGLGVATAGAVVTAVFPDSFYVESLDRSSGIRVVLPDGETPPLRGSIVTLTGTARTATNGERYVQASNYAVTSAGAVQPLGANARALFGGDFAYDPVTGTGQQGMAGGTGLNPTGLLVRVAGVVASREGARFLLDDASGALLSVQMIAGSVLPEPGDWVVATGVVSLTRNGEDLYPLLRLRAEDDLVRNARSLLGIRLKTPNPQFSAGQNLFAIPGLAYDPQPSSILTAYGDLRSRLFRWDRISGGVIAYDAPTNFGLLGPDEGYRLDILPGQPLTFDFDALRTDYADRWLSLPRSGESILGHPFIDPVTWEAVRVSDGFRTITLREAAKLKTPEWLSSVATYHDALNAVDRNLGLPEDIPDSDALLPWTAYWLSTFKPNLALIVPIRGGTPTLSGLEPGSVPAGRGELIVKISGTGFRIDSLARWNGSDRPTTVVSESRILVRLTATDVATPRQVPITVFNPGPRGGASDPLTFTIEQPENPLPVLRGALPNEIQTGTAPVLLQLAGEGFVPASSVIVNGDRRGPTFISANELALELKGSDLATAGILEIHVASPAPGGGVSDSVFVTVSPKPNPLPKLSRVIPNELFQNGPGFKIRVFGASFVPGSTIRLNGSPRATIYSSPKLLFGKILPGDAEVLGPASVTVVNPVPGGGESNAFAVTVVIANPIPALDAIEPNMAEAGSEGLRLSLTGHGFVPESVAYLNGSPRPTTYVSPTEVTALIPGEDLDSIGTRAIVVRNPSPGGGESAVQTLVVRSGKVRITLAKIRSTSRVGKEIRISAVLRNEGSVTVKGISLTGATLGGASISVATVIGDLGAGGLATVDLVFPSTVGNPGNHALLRIDGRYGAGSFSVSRKVKLP